MSIEFWLIYELLPLATMVIVPLGILLHYWRAADARRPAVTGRTAAAAWSAAARGQLRRARIASALATAAALAGAFGVIAPQRFDMDWYDFLAPLLTALLCTAALLTRPPALRRGDPPHASADSGLSGDDRRAQSTTAFGDRWWFGAWWLCLAALVAATVWAGLYSAPDANGNYTMHTIALEQGTAGTTIAGWYFGVPVIIAAMLLAVLVLIALRLQATPPLATDVGQDLWLRRAATRTLLSVSGGAVVVTLAWVLRSIGTSAQLTISAPSADDGVMTTLGSPLAPIGIPVRVLGLLLQGGGIALLMLPLLSRRVPREESANAGVPPLEHDEPQPATI